MLDTVTIVGKGPSASSSQDWIDAVETDVAVINESGLLLRSNQKIDYAFFSHLDFVNLSRPTWNRTSVFSGPSRFKIGGEVRDQFPRMFPPGFPVDRYDGYLEHECCGDERSIIDRIASGGIVHHHTATGAHHWLVKRGYKRVRVIGVDGGTQYANGMTGHTGPWSLDDWKRVHKLLSSILLRVYGAKTEWYS